MARRVVDGYIDPLSFVGGAPEQRGFNGYPVAPYIAPGVKVEAFVSVDAGTERATMIGSRTWLMKHVHVGHDAWIGPDCELAPHCSVGGFVVIRAGVRVGQGALFKPHVTVGEGARIGMGAVVICDVPAGEVWVGNPARKLRSPEEKAADLEALKRSMSVVQLQHCYSWGSVPLCGCIDPHLSHEWPGESGLEVCEGVG